MLPTTSVCRSASVNALVVPVGPIQPPTQPCCVREALSADDDARWSASEHDAVYERTEGAERHTLRETSLPVIIGTNTGNTSGVVRRTPLMRVKEATLTVLVGSMGGAAKNPSWMYNLRANGKVEIRDRPRLNQCSLTRC